MCLFLHRRGDLVLDETSDTTKSPFTEFGTNNNRSFQGEQQSQQQPSSPQQHQQQQQQQQQQQRQSVVPSLSLPKGGGAIRGIGEKFSVNAATGTGSLTVPIYTSPGRSGFGPQLSLSYDSGAGNGPFGLGWQLSIPSIIRKTDKGLPLYHEEEESDVFILSGSEDLVPLLNPDGSRFEDKTTVPGYTIHRYRPRIEALFVRIERWTRLSDGDIHWRSISKDNVLTVYGRDGNSRISDPRDNSGNTVFSWLICESYDHKGNAIVYKYSEENDEQLDLSLVNELNRERTANRYIKRIHYGNLQPLLLDTGKPSFRKSHLDHTDFSSIDWMFEVVFDYGEGHYKMLALDDSKSNEEQHQYIEASASVAGAWSSRPDPFSVYKAGFEIRTYRRCQRVLMFHRFLELGSEPSLVRSTEFDYSDFDYLPKSSNQNLERNVVEELAHKGSTRFASFIQSVIRSGYVQDKTKNEVVHGGFKYLTYLKKSLPPVEFEYSQASIHDKIQEIDPTSLENLPYGLDGSNYQWVDLDGEGISGILTEHAGEWFYKPNLGEGKLGSLKVLDSKPSTGSLGRRSLQLLDLAADGSLDVVQFDGPVSGFYERTDDQKWENFVPFRSMPNISWKDPNLRFVDLTGDGLADVLITEEQAFIWHPSLAKDGFGPASRVYQKLDEEKGPRLVIDDGSQSIYLADMSGDGLTDLVRIRNGEVCYWPNLGYSRFGAKVSMDNPPWFEAIDTFDQKRICLADIDGSGTTDIIYLGRNGVRIYFNQSGNRWSNAYLLSSFPQIDNLSSVVQAVDLLGNGTACLIWSSALPGNFGRQMRYIDLMGGQKPHLLIGSQNNLGAKTKVHYSSSTKFYLADRDSGKQWITRLPFPVHVVEKIEAYDYISRNRFVTRYTYHHGYFDGLEREFRGFGMVEQYDTEEFATLSSSVILPRSNNTEINSHVPPVRTKTWFHTGVYSRRDHVSDYFAGPLDVDDKGEYYREPSWQDDDDEVRKNLLDDTLLPPGLSIEEEREACRALKGSLLRQEVYALDGTDQATHPYTVTEQNFDIRCLQSQGNNQHAVFFVHNHELLVCHYDRIPSDPRISHALTLEVDDFGNVLKQVSVGYGRRKPDLDLSLQADRDKQSKLLVSYTENRVTNAILSTIDSYRTPLPCESHIYELTGYTPTGNAGRFQPADFVQPDPIGNPNALILFSVEDINYESLPTDGKKQRRLMGHVRTLYRKNNLTDLLPLSELESLALQGESYNLAFTPGLIAQVFQRSGQPLLLAIDQNNPANILGGEGADKGGYVSSQRLKAEGRFPDTDPDDHWWVPSGRLFYSLNSDDSAAQELEYASQHFFLPHRYRDPFHSAAVSTESFVKFDAYDLLIIETRDPAGNRVTVGERKHDGQIDPNKAGNDYRVLQPMLITDINRNRTEVSFDALGMVSGTALNGKDNNVGDTLDEFEPDLTKAQIDEFYDVSDPRLPAQHFLRGATSRVIYDLHRFHHTSKAKPDDPTQWLPVYAATLTREMHVSDLLPNNPLRIQISFSYSDGFGREIQKKIQAETDPVAVGMPKWIGSGWTVFNNKGKPIRVYEPFFSQLPPEKRHTFEFNTQAGVSPILFYDPVERVVVTLHPNHTYEKVVFDPWKQLTYDVNDTGTSYGKQTGDPRTDQDISGYVSKYFSSLNDASWQTWFQQRRSGAMGVEEQNAAEKAAAHADTPTTICFDTLGRPFLTVLHNRLEGDYKNISTIDEFYGTRVELDIEGNHRMIRDSIVQEDDVQGRIVMRYDYDVLGNRIHQLSMDAGDRWMLNDVAGKPIRAWDSRGHTSRIEYDSLRRPLRSFVTGADPANPNQELLTMRIVYGEQHPEDELRNLRGKVYLTLDQAGVASNEAHDFKGNSLRTSRRLAKQYKTSPNWLSVDSNYLALPTSNSGKLNLSFLEAILAPMLEADTFVSSAAYDALNRPIQVVAPHTNQPGTKLKVAQPVYNEAGRLEKLHVWLDRSSEPDGLMDAVRVPPSRVGIDNIDYNSKGQRTRISYLNGVSIFYEYDPMTFRLVHLFTIRNAAAFPDDCPQVRLHDWPGCHVQNLYYTFDPVGNITSVRDDAQQTVFFRNRRVKPSNEFTYDAIYRLTRAAGREHLGQVNGAPIPHSYDDAKRIGLIHPNDGRAMGTYTENYVYDGVGNLLKMQHRANEPSDPGWTRFYSYEETSLIEDGTSGTLMKFSNRLSKTTIKGSTALLELYMYDDHGNMTRMPQLQIMGWDYEDRLCMTQRQKVNDEDKEGIKREGERTYYVYNATGQRLRKVTVLASGKLKDERIYLEGLEIYRKHFGANIGLVRETLHLMDNKQRIALVETRNDIDDGTLKQFVRYQFSNHIGSATLELDDDARIISYEEYTPYGSTSFQAVRSQTETPKRYRYAGKERDEESGLYYIGRRYYIPWIGRWIQCDPAGFIDGLNLYEYVTGNPTRFSDPTGFGAREQDLGAKMEKASKAHQDAANARRRQKGLDPIEVDRQQRVGGERKTIPDELKTTPGGTKKVIDTKARHVDSAYNQLSSERVKDIERNLEQVKNQLVELEKAGKIGSETKGAALRVIHDSDKGASSAQALAKWKNEGIEAREAWLAAAKDPAERALRSRVFVTTTTREAYAEATSTLRRSTRSGGGKAGLLIGAAIAAYIFFDTGDAWAAAQSVNPAGNTTDLLMSHKITVLGAVEAVGRDAAMFFPPSAIALTIWDLGQPRGDFIYDESLAKRAIEEGRNPFCAQCHGPGGALDPNNAWNQRARFGNAPNLGPQNKEIDLDTMRAFIGAETR